MEDKSAQMNNHARQLASETANIQFHWVKVEYYPEDLARMENMSLDEKVKFVSLLKKNGRYKVRHDSPASDEHQPILDCKENGAHVIAVTAKTFAIAAGSRLYSKDYKWGLETDAEIISVIPRDGCEKDYPYGQFVILLKDGTVREVWSESCIRKLSEGTDFCGVAAGCGGKVFGLRKNGTVITLCGDAGDSVSGRVAQWQNVRQIDAGPRHVVGLKTDGTVVSAGKETACAPLAAWTDIKKIYVSKTAPLFGKTNDLTFGIDSSGALLVDGDLWGKGEGFWNRIRAQRDVTDVVENGYAVWTRHKNGALSCITYYGPMNYAGQTDFMEKLGDSFRYMDTYAQFMVAVDHDGEFRVFNDELCVEVKWFSFRLDEPV
ncbi:MAG: hypothetical protein K2M79_07000 [Muribaculaceae bacterium]|nr:hypothetical protein [Muribaculaceae bacterium]